MDSWYQCFYSWSKEMHMMQKKFIQPLSFDEFGEFTGFAGLLVNKSYTINLPCRSRDVNIPL